MHKKKDTTTQIYKCRAIQQKYMQQKLMKGNTSLHIMHYNKTNIHAMQQNKMQNMLKHTYETSACNVGQ